MPQALLPLIPAGAPCINQRISVVQQEGTWTYFCGIEPIFQHPERDSQSFWLITAQLVCQNACKQVDIVRAFGVSQISVKRNVKKFREQGNEGFFQPRQRRQGKVLTKQVLEKAQDLLSQNVSRRQVANELGVLPGTLRKAINQGRLHEPDPHDKPTPPTAASDKSERSLEDASAQMGNACTRPEERVLASLRLSVAAS